MASRTRLFWHVLVALMIVGGVVVAPLLLLLREQLGVVAVVIGLTLLAFGCSSLLGAILVRSVDSRECSRLQWRCIVGAAWVFNPITVVCTAVKLGYLEVVCWSGIPFGVVFALLTRRVQLLDSDPPWDQDSGCGCPPRLHLILQWLFSRSVFVVVPVAVLSFQVTLYLPQASLLPQGAEIGLFVCGGCVLISAKFCAMCAAMSKQRISQALVLILLLSADWISSLHLLELVGDEAKTLMLLIILQLIGLIQLRAALTRLQLFSRCSRRRQRARELARCRANGDEAQLRLLEAGIQGSDSSDSDDEAGPGSLPDGFHNTLLGIIGVPMNRELQARRQFLCPARQAVVRQGSHVSGVSLPPLPGSTSVMDSSEACADGHAQQSESNVSVEENPPLTAEALALPIEQRSTATMSVSSSGASSTSSNDLQSTAPPASRVELTQDDRLCAICQEDIATGESVRPLPKCNHYFHAACLERWAKVQREGTKCPLCKKPALSKRAGEGSLPISELQSDDSPSSSSPSRRESGRPTRNRSDASARRGGRTGNRRQGSGRGPSRIGEPVSPAVVQELVSSLQVSQVLARAALEFANGNQQTAGGLIIEHATVLQAMTPTAGPDPPRGLAEALVAANPFLVGSEDELRQQLRHLLAAGRIGSRAWNDLAETAKLQVFRTVLADVSRRLEAAEA